jgi:hypothetical protein
MAKSSIVFGLFFLLAIASASAAPVISIGTQYLSNTDVDQRIPIMVSSATNDRIEAIYLAVQIGDGGVLNGGVNTIPRITDLDIIGPGTIFNASNMGSNPQYLGNQPHLIALDETVTLSGDLEANGILAWLTLNAYGATLGSSYKISLQNVGANIQNGPWATDLITTSVSFAPNDGWITIVPEPSTGIMLIIASMVCLCRRRFF